MKYVFLLTAYLELYKHTQMIIFDEKISDLKSPARALGYGEI